MNKNLTIKNWVAGDRPREKFLCHGGEGLSIAELLAIIIGSGTRERNAVELARIILAQAGGSLNSLKNFSIEELKRFSGIGDKKAVTIMAVFELLKRAEIEKVPPVKQIYSSENAASIVAPLLRDLKHEECWILYLDRGNRLLSKEKISSGGISSTIVDCKIIIKRGIAKLASGIILVHNHPSGKRMPGTEDIKQTQRLKEAARMCDISLLDHIIIAGNTYYSFADEGCL